MKISIPTERRDNETRVAASPEVVKKLIGLGFQVVVQKDAGLAASFTDAAFRDARAAIAKDAPSTIKGADIVFKSQAPLAGELSQYKKGQILLASLGALSNPKEMQALARVGVAAFAMEFFELIDPPSGRRGRLLAEPPLCRSVSCASCPLSVSRATCACV